MAKGFYKKFVLTVFIVGSIVFFNNYLADNFLQNLIYKIVKKPGIFLTDNLLNFSKYAGWFLKTKAVIDENSKLREENNILHGQLAKLDSVERENDFLSRVKSWALASKLTMKSAKNTIHRLIMQA